MHDTSRYDRTTIFLHWITAAITLFLFISPYVWRTFERRTPPRLAIQFYHFSFGLLLAVILLGRIVWRAKYGKKLDAPKGSRNYRTARFVHYALYTLLAVQICLGIWTRFAQNNPLVFFGLFQIPTPFNGAQESAPVLAYMHYVIAWLTVALASAHALVALVHHFVLKDGLMSRLSLKSR